jgi:metal-dependent amidase/aminoacylase/carboxypeptidase family protein
MPESSVEPVVMAAATVLRLQTIVSREVAATQSAVVTIGALQAGTKDNVIDDAVLKVKASGAPRVPKMTTTEHYHC